MRWDESRLQSALTLREQGYPWTEIGEKFGVSADAIRSAVTRFKEREQRFTDLAPLPPPDWDTDFLDYVIKQQEIETQLDTSQEEATVEIDTQQPIGIVFTGDWHIGGKGTDHKLMREDLTIIRDTDGLYAIGMADYIDNFIQGRVPPGQNEQQFRPEMQLRLFRKTVERYFIDKALALLVGNHDFWTSKAVGYHPIMDLAAEHGKPYLAHGGVLWLKLPGATYKLALRHDFPGRSAINTMNNQRRMFEYFGGADVIALGHLHFSDVQITTKGGWDTIWLRTGSYKVNDDYAAEKLGAKGDPRMPMVIFWPGQKRAWACRDFKEGLDYLKFVRRDVA